MMPIHSNLHEFRTVVDWRLAGADDLLFFDLHYILTQLAFDCPYLVDTLNAELRAILREPLQLSPTWRPARVVPFEEKLWRFEYGLMPTKTDFIHSHVGHAMIAVIGPEPLVVDRYKPSHDIDNDVFDPQVALLLPKRKVYAPGSICVVDTRKGLFDFLVESPTFVMILSGRVRRAIQWVFSRHTLQAVHAIPGNPNDAHIAEMIGALTAMGSATSIATLYALTAHSSHVIRWSALQALARLNPEAAKASLQRATKDAHPHVRSASEKAIAAMAA
ncbi:MAG TPA: HEAT repeat domain-containing protein [Rudaea sp.]|jgi:hypothetical protein|nr:HEAT repeat domain-containing protein [Rudaea sp.]